MHPTLHVVSDRYHATKNSTRFRVQISRMFGKKGEAKIIQQQAFADSLLVKCTDLLVSSSNTAE